MNQQIEKFLEFNGKTLLFLSVNGTYYVAIKPICEAIGIEYTRAFKNITADPILGPRLAKQPMMVPGDSQPRKFVCIQEQFIYGWLFSIQSSNPDLISYKVACYELLYNYFHGTITQRKKFLQEKETAKNQIAELNIKLSENEDYRQMDKLKATIKQAQKELLKLDDTLKKGQFSLFDFS